MLRTTFSSGTCQRRSRATGTRCGCTHTHPHPHKHTHRHTHTHTLCTYIYICMCICTGSRTQTAHESCGLARCQVGFDHVSYFVGYTHTHTHTHKSHTCPISWGTHCQKSHFSSFFFSLRSRVLFRGAHIVKKVNIY